MPQKANNQRINFANQKPSGSSIFGGATEIFPGLLPVGDNTGKPEK